MLLNMNTDGTILAYDDEMKTGVILSHERQEKQYRFSRREWLSTYTMPRRGIIVSFDIAGAAAMKVTAVGISSTIT